MERQKTNEEFWTDERVYETIGEARKLFSSTKTTEDQWDALERVLGLAYLYCSERLQDIVMSTLNESTARRLLSLTL